MRSTPQRGCGFQYMYYNRYMLFSCTFVGNSTTTRQTCLVCSQFLPRQELRPNEAPHFGGAQLTYLRSSSVSGTFFGQQEKFNTDHRLSLFSSTLSNTRTYQPRTPSTLHRPSLTDGCIMLLTSTRQTAQRADGYKARALLATRNARHAAVFGALQPASGSCQTEFHGPRAAYGSHNLFAGSAIRDNMFGLCSSNARAFRLRPWILGSRHLCGFQERRNRHFAAFAT